METALKKKINLIFFSLLIFFLFQGFSSAEWITKKSDISKKLLEVDDMYSKGYLDKSECVKAKAKLLKISNASGMCDNVVLKNNNTNENAKTYNWAAEVGHPKTNRIFTADRVSTKDNAIKIAIKKCYEYVAANLNKGYNDCFVKNVYDSSKNNKKASSSWITKKDIKKSEDLIKRLRNFPYSDFYVYAFKGEEIFLVGYANEDQNSKMIKVNNRKFRKGNMGTAYKSNDIKCFTYSEVDENSLGNRSYTGTVKVHCNDKSSYVGNWVQFGEKGSGKAIDSNSGESVDFSFAMSKNIALTDLNQSFNQTEFAKKDNESQEITQEEFKPKNLIEDNSPPIIKISKSITVNDSNYKISGEVVDNSDKIFIEVDGTTILADKNGKFEIPRFSPVNEKLEITAIDKWGNVSEPVLVEIIIDKKSKKVVKKIEPLDPSKFNSKININRVALIIGIEKYDQTPDATFANLDAEYFYEYAKKGFGISEDNIKKLIDNDANITSSIGAIYKWLPGKIKKNKTELFIFFAGHGLASDNGKELYILPQDSDPDLLRKTALSRTEIFEQILKLSPKSVTMFMDTCYSGISRDEQMLLASARPIRIVTDDQEGIPDNFTIFTASKLKQISSGFKEAKHGIFSYYLMKGLEGKADSNNDKKITNGELLAYMNENVSQKAAELGREQNPSLAGDPEKILISYR